MGLVPFKDLCQIFELMGIPEGKPAGNAQLNYSVITPKTIRVLNRLGQYLSQNKLDIKVFLGDAAKTVPIKTASKTQNIEIVESELFFTKLYESSIIKKNVIQDNLCQLFCIDRKYANMLMVKKIKRTLSDIKPNKVRYFSQIGLKKKKL